MKGIVEEGAESPLIRQHVACIYICSCNTYLLDKEHLFARLDVHTCACADEEPLVIYGHLHISSLSCE